MQHGTPNIYIEVKYSQIVFVNGQFHTQGNSKCYTRKNNDTKIEQTSTQFGGYITHRKNTPPQPHTHTLTSTRTQIHTDIHRQNTGLTPKQGYNLVKGYGEK